MNSKTYTLYLGTPSPFPVLGKVQPHLTQSNGLMFDGQDYLSFNVMNQAATSDILTFGDQFTIEMWLRFTEPQVSQTYTFFQKLWTFGKELVVFQYYLTPENTFVVEVNKTVVLSMRDAYDGQGGWTYLGVSLYSGLYYTLDG